MKMFGGLRLRAGDDRGFTMLELMTVVAIISIMTAAFIPQLTGYRDRARVRNAQSALANVRTVQETVRAMEGSYAQSSATIPTTTLGTLGTGETTMAEFLDFTFSNVGFRAMTLTNTGGSSYVRWQSWTTITGNSDAYKLCFTVHSTGTAGLQTVGKVWLSQTDSAMEVSSFAGCDTT
ncbi:MAG: type IV pilin protein [Candidatus Bipolaricaulia bacterium]